MTCKNVQASRKVKLISGKFLMSTFLDLIDWQLSELGGVLDKPVARHVGTTPFLL